VLGRIQVQAHYIDLATTLSKHFALRQTSLKGEPLKIVAPQTALRLWT
jgi:hypothetical protein